MALGCRRCHRRRPRRRSDGIDLLSRAQVELVAGAEPVVPAVGMARVVVDGDAARADDLEAIALDDQRGVVVDAEAQQIRVRVHDVHQLGVAFGRGQVRIDRDLLEEAEATVAAPGHEDRLVRPPAHDERPLDDRSRGGAEDGAAAGEQGLDLAVRARLPIRGGQPAGIPGGQVDGAGAPNRRDERLRIGDGAVARVEDRHAVGTEPLPEMAVVGRPLRAVSRRVRVEDRVVVAESNRRRGGREHDDAGRGAPGQRDETVSHHVGGAAAVHDERSPGRTGRLRPQRAGGQREGQREGTGSSHPLSNAQGGLDESLGRSGYLTPARDSGGLRWPCGRARPRSGHVPPEVSRRTEGRVGSRRLMLVALERAGRHRFVSCGAARRERAWCGAVR